MFETCCASVTSQERAVSTSESACAAQRTKSSWRSQTRSSRASSSSWTGAEMKNELYVIVYAPALVGGDSRPLAVVRGMERALPGLRLEWTLSEEGRHVPLPQRDAWITQQRTDGLPFLCNRDES